MVASTLEGIFEEERDVTISEELIDDYLRGDGLVEQFTKKE